MKHQPLLKKKATTVATGTDGTPAAVVQALADAGMLAWPADPDPSGLPTGLSVRAVGTGVEVDAYLLFRVLLATLAEESVEDPEGIAEELAALNAARGPGRDALLDEWVERLGGAEVRYPTARSVHRLIERLARAAGPVLPVQREREAG